MNRSMVPGSRASRALTALAGNPGGLLTPDIARMLGEHPWGLTEIARELRKQESRGNVTADRSHRGAPVLWKLTERGRRTAEAPAGSPAVHDER